MRVIFANTFDTRGGAARAALRLFEGVSAREDVWGRMVVQEKGGELPEVVRHFGALPADLTSKWDQAGLKGDHPDRIRVPFSVNRVPSLAPLSIKNLKPDVVHLHWLHCGFLRLEQLRSLNVPLVWTIHDMWAFTGVCHYSGGCTRYMSGCGHCPLLKSGDGDDISRQVFRRKAATYADLDLTIVSPSNWLAGLAKSSPLLSGHTVKVIPNGIDTDLFKPLEKVVARKQLNLPLDRPVLLFGADFAMTDARKGSHLLLEALAGLSADVTVAIFGCDQPDSEPALPMDIHWLGKISDDSKLVAAYSAADLFAAPSLEENLSNAVMESLACGTPVMAFDIGGMGDMIINDETGFLVQEEAGAQGLKECLERAFNDVGWLESLGRNARKLACEEFDDTKISQKYFNLYDGLISSR